MTDEEFEKMRDEDPFYRMVAGVLLLILFLGIWALVGMVAVVRWIFF